ncbi:MAG: hypothetical protein IPM64_15170 [Phycisphaerales bacterium]|nr:hypothetical protein [Phycisphaerales bacterium]
MSGHLVIGNAPNSPVAGRFSGLNQMDLAGTVTLGTPASPPQEFTGGIDITGELTGTLKTDLTTAEAGKTAYYDLRCLSAPGETGPWSEIAAATVAA